MAYYDFADVHYLYVKKKRVYFEFHKFCGPLILKKNGDPKKRQPGSRSPFWPPFERWLRRAT